MGRSLRFYNWVARSAGLVRKPRPGARGGADPYHRRLICEPLEERRLLSLTVAQLVDDINPALLAHGGDPSNLCQVGSLVYFTGNTQAAGSELWKSDGTAAGTVLVKDICPGYGSSNPGNLTDIGGTLFFTAADGTTGNELWKSDGTTAGTVLVKDIYPGSSENYTGYTYLNNSNPSNLTNVGGTLFFSAYDGANGRELWKSDGSTDGTVLLKDIYPGITHTYDGYTHVNNSNPSNLTNVGGTLFFTANDGATGTELWTSDGTIAGTVLFKDIYPGGSWRWGYNFDLNYYPNSSNPSNLTNVGGTLFFSANDGATGTELWTSDGTAAGTTLLEDIRPGYGSSSPGNLTNGGGMLFFSANDGTTGNELWKSDGTAAGTVLVKDINPGNGGYPNYNGYGSNPTGLTNVGGTLYFAANDGTTGTELWKSDGTAAGTVLVKDIYPGSSYRDYPYYSYGLNNSYPSNLTNVGGTLFFAANDGTTGYELWKSDGTAAGTVLVKDIYPGSYDGGSVCSANPANLTNVGGTLFFAADDGVNGAALWKSDASGAGTVLITDLWIEPESSWPRNLTNVGGTLFFTAYNGTTGYELWKSDGTAAGTVLVKDINPGSGGSNPRYLTNVGGTLFFGANDGTTGWELWKSDGTAAGTVLVKDVNAGSSTSSLSNLTNVGGTLFFTAYNGTTGYELWKSDGTDAGTVLVKDIFPGGFDDYPYGYVDNSSSPSNLTNVGGTLFFTANDGTTGNELWKSDGTAAGTVLVKDIYPGSSYRDYPYYYGLNNSNPSHLTNVGGTLFFTANDGTNGGELWRSDGTAAGTVLVKDIRPGLNSSGPRSLTNVGGALFFSAGDDTNGMMELWKSDGTAAGTVLVKDISPGSRSSNPWNLTNVGGALFFTANDGTTGTELWKSDGTAAGTVLVKDIFSGGGGSFPWNLTDVGGTLFFRAWDGVSGGDLWKSDGTTAGTVLVDDINPWRGGSYPYGMTNVSGTLYFTANDGTTGAELWKVQQSDLIISAMCASGFKQGDAADTYTITVGNVGLGPTTDAVTVVDVLPTGLAPTAADNGTLNGWTLSASGQTITATRSDPLAVGSSYPTLTLTVRVAADAPPNIINTATVSGGGEQNTANDTATDLAPVQTVLTDVTSAKIYSAVEYKKTASLVLMTFTDAIRTAVAGDFTPKLVTWGGATAGTPTLSVVKVAGTANTWNVMGAVTYTQKGMYAISVTVRDKAGHGVTSSGMVRFNVADAPLTNATAATTYAAVEGKATGNKVLAVFKDADPKALASDFLPAVAWGGAVVGTPVVSVKFVSRTATVSTWDVLGGAVYAEKGTYNVSVSVLDVDGSGLTAAGKVKFNVADAPLTNATTTAVYQAVAGHNTGSQVLATFTDGNRFAPTSDFRATVTWGGAVVGTPAVSVRLVSRGATSSTWNVMGSAVYKTAGSYPVSVSVKDIEGSTLSSTGKISFSVAAALMADSTVVARGVAPSVSDGQVVSMLAAAEQRWAAVGGTRVLAALSGVKIQLADLPSGVLGEAVGKTILIDRDAAGYGWFVDPTPAADEEFAASTGSRQLKAVDPRAVDRIDLLSVVEHELGHVLGLGDLSASVDDVMSGILGVAVRRNASYADAAPTSI